MSVIRDLRSGDLQRWRGHAGASSGSFSTTQGTEASPGWGVPLQDLLRHLWRWKLPLVLAAVIGIAAGMGFSGLREPRYLAEGLLVIDTAHISIPELSALASGRTVEPWGGRSEARILTARETVAAAVDDLNLVDDPAFNPTLAPTALARAIAAPWMPVFLAELIEMHAPAAWLEQQPDTGPQQRAGIISGLQGRLEVASEERSYAITLAYASSSPERAADVVNAVMGAYVERDLEVKRAELVQARDELERRLAEIATELGRAQLALSDLEGQSDLVVGDGGTIRARALDALISEAQALRIDRERVRADIARVDAALAGRADVVMRGDLVTPRLQELWAQEALIVRDLAEAGEVLGPRHPQILQLEAKLAGISGAIIGEVRSVRDGLARESDLIDEREARLVELTDRAAASAGATAEGRVGVELARQEVQSLQQLNDLYRERYEQTLLGPALVAPDARIVSAAAPPTSPQGPGRNTLGALGGLIATLLAAGGLVAHRWLGDRLSGPDDVERASGLPVLGVLPVLSRRKGALAGNVTRLPEGPASETLRAMLSRLRVPYHQAAAQVVLVTSSTSGDGKTSLSLAMARAAVREGLRCLVVEGDCRRPGLSAALGADVTALSEDKSGANQLPYSILKDPAGGAHILAAKPMADLAPALLRSERLRQLFANARTYYDLIIIDGPPLLATADPLLLAKHADQALLVAAAGQTDAPSLAAAARRLAETDCEIAGVVFNKCPAPMPKAYAFAGYASHTKLTRRAL